MPLHVECQGELKWFAEMVEFELPTLRKSARPDALLLAFVLFFSFSCAAPRSPGSFRVLPAKPDYLLRAPDSRDTPFPEVLRQHTNVDRGWVELRPRMELRIENAYFRGGTPRRGLSNYLGTEIARYNVRPNGGLRLVAAPSGLAQRPADQPPVQQLLQVPQRRYPHHRFFYQVLLNHKAGTQNAILLSAPSMDQLDRLTRQLVSAPDSVCDRGSLHCTVFPEACSVALEMEIVVNGTPRTALWGSFVSSVVARPRHLELLRLFAGRLAPVEMDLSDPNALRLPLLPGDRLTWR
jgi:hypothetical protein